MRYCHDNFDLEVEINSRGYITKVYKEPPIDDLLWSAIRPMWVPYLEGKTNLATYDLDYFHEV